MRLIAEVFLARRLEPHQIRNSKKVIGDVDVAGRQVELLREPPTRLLRRIAGHLQPDFARELSRL